MAWLGTISFLTLHKTICCSVMTVLFLQWQDLQYLCIGALYVVVTNQWRMEQKRQWITLQPRIVWWCMRWTTALWWCNNELYDDATVHLMKVQQSIVICATEHCEMVQQRIEWWCSTALYDGSTMHCMIV